MDPFWNEDAFPCMYANNSVSSGSHGCVGSFMRMGVEASSYDIVNGSVNTVECG